MRKEVIGTEEVVNTILMRNEELLSRNIMLEEEHADLRKRFTRYEKPGKDRHNSSV